MAIGFFTTSCSSDDFRGCECVAREGQWTDRFTVSANEVRSLGIAESCSAVERFLTTVEGYDSASCSAI